MKILSCVAGFGVDDGVVRAQKGLEGAGAGRTSSRPASAYVRFKELGEAMASASVLMKGGAVASTASINTPCSLFNWRPWNSVSVCMVGSWLATRESTSNDV